MSGSSPAPGSSFVCWWHWGADVLLCVPISLGVWRCPPGCLAPSASFPTGHSLSGGLGAPHISALLHSLNFFPSSSPKELSGFRGKPSPSRASLFYSRSLSQTFSECLASSGSLRLWSTKAYKKLFFLSFTSCHSHVKSS